MPVLKATGESAKAGNIVIVETPRRDELPAGVPAPTREESPQDRGEAGRFARGNSLARAGGKARAGKTRLADRLGLSSLPEGADFRPYKSAAIAFRRAQTSEVARTVGGGVCGPGPSSLIASAALSLAWSRYFSDVAAETGDVDLAVKAARLGEISRSHLLGAHELAAKEALAREAARPATIDPLGLLRSPPAALPAPRARVRVDEDEESATPTDETKASP